MKTEANQGIPPSNSVLFYHLGGLLTVFVLAMWLRRVPIEPDPDRDKALISASIGISIYRGDGERIKKLLSQADEKLYAGKARRRQRGVFSEPAPRRNR